MASAAPGRCGWRLTVGAGLLVLVAAARAQSVVLGAEDDAAPWSYADGTGYVNDVVRAAFREAGWSLQLKVMPYARCKSQAMAGQLAGCFSASRTPELEAALLYPKQPVFQARNLLLVRADSPWSGCDPATWGPRPVIGLVRGYEYIGAVQAMVAAGRVQADETDSEISNLRKLEARRIDAGVVTVDEVKRIDYLVNLAKVGSAFRTACDFGAVPAYVAFSRAHPDGAAALAAFDEGHRRLAQRGAIATLQAQWRSRALNAAAAKKH